jgi:hypothetical protein
MATGMPWPGELDVLKKGVAKLIGEDLRKPEGVSKPEDFDKAITRHVNMKREPLHSQ